MSLSRGFFPKRNRLDAGWQPPVKQLVQLQL